MDFRIARRTPHNTIRINKQQLGFIAGVVFVVVLLILSLWLASFVWVAG